MTSMLLFKESPSLIGVVMGLSLFSTSVFCILLLALADGNWNAFEPATCLVSPLGCFCERPRDTLLRQPTNTVTNLSFTIAGILILMEGIQQWGKSREIAKKTDKSVDSLGYVFNATCGVANLILGLGSMWYHASLTFVGQFIDNAGMYLVVLGPALFALKSSRNTEPSTRTASARFVLEYILSNIFAGYLAFTYSSLRRHVFLLLIVFAILCEMYARFVGNEERRRQGKLVKIVLSAAVMILAFTIWNLDTYGYWCDPDSVLQGHGLWHVLTGVSSFLLYSYYHPIAFPELIQNRMGEGCSIV